MCLTDNAHTCTYVTQYLRWTSSMIVALRACTYVYMYSVYMCVWACWVNSNAIVTPSKWSKCSLSPGVPIYYVHVHTPCKFQKVSTAASILIQCTINVFLLVSESVHTCTHTALVEWWDSSVWCCQPESCGCHLGSWHAPRCSCLQLNRNQTGIGIFNCE